MNQYGEVAVLFKVVKGKLTSSEVNEAITQALHNMKIKHPNGAQLVLLDATDPSEPGTMSAWENLDNWYGETDEAKRFGFPVPAQIGSGWVED